MRSKQNFKYKKMKKILLLAFSILTVISCDNDKNIEEIKKDTPKRIKSIKIIGDKGRSYLYEYTYGENGFIKTSKRIKNFKIKGQNKTRQSTSTYKYDSNNNIIEVTSDDGKFKSNYIYVDNKLTKQITINSHIKSVSENGVDSEQEIINTSTTIFEYQNDLVKKVIMQNEVEENKATGEKEIKNYTDRVNTYFYDSKKRAKKLINGIWMTSAETEYFYLDRQNIAKKLYPSSYFDYENPQTSNDFIVSEIRYLEESSDPKIKVYTKNEYEYEFDKDDHIKRIIRKEYLIDGSLRRTFTSEIEYY